MKLTHVFGLVVAVHAAVFTVIFATPGCRSTGKPKPRPEDTSPANAGVTNAPVDNLAALPVAAMSNDAINAGPVVQVPVAAAAADATAVVPATPDAPIHFAPTRPSAVVEAPAPVAASATHTVVKGDSLWTIARKYGITTAELSAANKLAPSATLRLGQQLAVPARAAAPANAGTAADAANTYAVKPGDTLGAIARKHGTSAAALRTANNLKGDNLRVGQKLVIPGNAAPITPSTSAPAGPAAPVAPVAAPRAGGATHTIAPGDTLGSIARKYGVKVGEIGTLNNITDPAKLRVGQVIKLPVGARSEARPGATPAATPSASAAPAVRAEPALPAPVTPVGPAEGFTPVSPVSPVEPGAVPVIRIE